MMKILLCFGTRPEAIKMAPVYHVLQKADVEVKVCVTAQHREMLDQVLDFFSIVPHYDLNLMQPDQSLNQLSSRILHAIDDVLEDFQPDFVLVHGDTTTSSIVALAAFHRGIKIGHVEAGLRTYDKTSPFPEEMNRQITSRIADFHFAPTLQSAANLLQENIKKEAVFVTGNTVIDALQLGLNRIKNGYNCPDLEFIKSLIIPGKKIILITGHRRENFGDGLENLCNAIKEIANNENIQIIYPVHLNPKVQEPVLRILRNLENVNLIRPIDYPAFIYLIQNCYLILTDSGGIQEEAPTLKKPVVLMRRITERPEAVEAGAVILTGTDKEKIISVCNSLLNDFEYYKKITNEDNPFGDGQASKRIINHLISF